MPSTEPTFSWESWPEYIAVTQYTRCIERILHSLPRRERRKTRPALHTLADTIGKAIVCVLYELPADQALTSDERALVRSTALSAIETSRMVVLEWKRTGRGGKADVLTALELLERVEAAVRDRPLRPIRSIQA